MKIQIQAIKPILKHDRIFSDDRQPIEIRPSFRTVSIEERTNPGEYLYQLIDLW